MVRFYVSGTTLVTGTGTTMTDTASRISMHVSYPPTPSPVLANDRASNPYHRVTIVDPRKPTWLGVRYRHTKHLNRRVRRTRYYPKG